MHRILLEFMLFGKAIKIYSYGFMVAMGFFIGFLLALRKARKAGINEDHIFSVTILSVIMALVGGRVFYIILNWNDFLANPKVYILSREGFVFLGGFVFAVIAAITFVKLKKLKLWVIADIFAPSIPIGHAIGRLGCFLNGCCFGKPTDGACGMIFPAESVAGYLHPFESLIPTQIFSSLGNFLIFVALTIIYRNKKFNGQVFALYFIIYPIFRFLIEFIRGDYGDNQYYFLNLTLSQITGFFILIFGIAGYLILKKRNHDQVLN